ncbi:hypothetical protein NUACC21_65050 [Scytonema sp. NUACC21]
MVSDRTLVGAGSSQTYLHLFPLYAPSPLRAIIHSLKEDFHNLFEDNKDVNTGSLKLIDWLKKAKPYYQKSVRTIQRWFGEIVGYFERGTTSGIVEGINNKLKLIWMAI